MLEVRTHLYLAWTFMFAKLMLLKILGLREMHAQYD